MNVTLVSTHGVRGGAARATKRLHDGLRAQNCDARLLTRFHSGEDTAGIQPVYPATAVFKNAYLSAKSLMLRLPVMRYQTGPNCDLFSLSRGPIADMDRRCQDADVVHLHWITAMVDLPSLLTQLPNHIPMVWTLHDLNLMTGGCHYNGPCDLYQQQCGSCPELHSRRVKDLAHRNFNFKRDLFDQIDPQRLTIVAPSRWIGECAQKSRLLRRFRICHLPNGIDVDIFKPTYRDARRKQLQLRRDEVAMLFVADSVGNFRKGFDLLLKALRQLKTADPVVLLVLGRAEQSQLARVASPNIRIISLGYIEDEHEMAEIYSAADLFVIPSRQDNLPNTVLESLACGTPVVGFRQGGIIDMVIDGETGLLARPNDCESLSAMISTMIENRDLRTRMSPLARQWVLQHFTLKQMASEHISLYQELTSQIAA
ncbi:glycosyltransferase [Stieleria sp. JC731]|uniref:glycosyltransferase n=1 Tax=Pirellulaceae TaxID=2691357 RepID=UPI001E2DAB41|nr:glycosyltransferase [Stieleria sp. JC731]MCC9599042.1 glycosyltransferase [Stieleria sp. JC731]